VKHFYAISEYVNDLPVYPLVTGSKDLDDFIQTLCGWPTLHVDKPLSYWGSGLFQFIGSILLTAAN